MKALSILGVVATLISSSVNAEHKFIDLHSSFAFTSGSGALAINNLNQVVGYQNDRNFFTNETGRIPVLWDANTLTTTRLSEPKDRITGYASDINESGQIVTVNRDFFSNYTATFVDGNSSHLLPSDGLYSLFVFNNHKPFELNNNGQVIANNSFRFNGEPNDTFWDANGTPKELNIAANGFNDNNQFVGHSTFNGSQNAALFQNGDTIDLGRGFTWAKNATAIDINNSGQIIATGVGALGGRRSFLIEEDGTVRSLKGSGDQSEAIAINEHGIVAGMQYLQPSNDSPYFTERQSEAVIWDGHNQYRLNDFLDQESKDAGWVLVTAFDINDNGWVVGEAFNILTGETHAYALSTDEMLSPIPEPSTFLMLLAGLGLLGFAARRNAA